jgi:hypothetical protein
MADANVVYVKPYQVRAAKLAVQLAKDQGRKPSPLMVRIANAKNRPPAAAAGA